MMRSALSYGRIPKYIRGSVPRCPMSYMQGKCRTCGRDQIIIGRPIVDLITTGFHYASGPCQSIARSRETMVDDGLHLQPTVVQHMVALS